ncbi:Polyhydroxyalkanoic acid inclusion protein (PhaP_Bmeg) [Mesobacillus persicus]|uniref:Polyhydroxyalkanoic acid inclusion protein (PhaP_Bmeg) n=1 Tax=Mesobacillus persicus TaxID=930146 RepID=A0A1H8CRL6_9BACI|nr:hypothetical protein [Mesobacillus persicus]SEM96777.1 Polyhydroxyalkanoic acid inclusion protein (PhaP_Bmeg) [Mesobacillus persicus]
MAKKNETIEVTETNTNPTDLFVNTLWDQYEQSLARFRKLRETQEDAFLNSFKEVLKFNKEYRSSIGSLYQQTRKTNLELAKGVVSNINNREEKVEVAPKLRDFDEVTNQLKEVTQQVEKLAITPVKSTFTFIDQLEQSLEKNAESYLTYSRERRKAWQQVTDEYVKQARKTNHEAVGFVREKSKELVKAAKSEELVNS